MRINLNLSNNKVTILMDFKGVVVEVALTSLLSWYGKNQVLTKFGHSSQIGELWSVNDIFRGS